MDEHAWVAVTVGIDVQVAASACDTAADILAVVLEIHCENRLGSADVADAVVHKFTLLRVWQQSRNRIVAHRHIVEVPDKLGSPLHHLIDEVVGTDRIQVLAGIAAGQTKRQMLFLEDCHCLNHLLIGSLTTTVIGRFLKALDADGWDKVFDPQHFVSKFLVDEGCIGKAQELAVAMLFAQGNQILFAHQRFAAGVDVHINAQLLALGDD